MKPWQTSKSDSALLFSEHNHLRLMFTQQDVPSNDILKPIRSQLCDEVREEQARDKCHRALTHRTHLQDDWSRTRSEVFSWCKGKSECKPALLKTAAGGLTGNVGEIDRLSHDALMPILQMYADCEEPSWQVFATRFQCHFLCSVAMAHKPLSV